MISSDLLNQDILTLGLRADERRRAQSPEARVLYQRVHVLKLADVRDGLVVPEPATEVRVMGTPETLDDAVAIVRAAKEAAGPRAVTAFSAVDLLERAQAGWGDVPSVLTRLAGAGLADFAEWPVDLIDEIADIIRAARAAGLRASRLTVAKPAGDRKAEILERMAACAATPGGLARVNPLPRNVPVDTPTTGYEDVRMVALARLSLPDGHDSAPVRVEVDWSLYGPKLAQVALTFGADFLDAVPATSDASLGRRRGTVEEVERNIRAAGFEPEEYRPLPVDGGQQADESRGAR